MPLQFDSKQPKKGKKPSMFAPAATVDNPTDIEPTGDLVQDTQAELDSLQSAYRKRRETEEKRFTNATDSEYWVAICFKDRASKEAFINGIGAQMLGDKYIDGHALARLLNVDLT